MVDATQGGKDLDPVLQGVDRPGRALEPTDPGVGVHPDHQGVAEGFGLAQVSDVAPVQDVEAAVGEDDPLAEPLGGPGGDARGRRQVARRLAVAFDPTDELMRLEHAAVPSLATTTEHAAEARSAAAGVSAPAARAEGERREEGVARPGGLRVVRRPGVGPVGRSPPLEQQRAIERPASRPPRLAPVSARSRSPQPTTSSARSDAEPEAGAGWARTRRTASS